MIVKGLFFRSESLWNLNIGRLQEFIGLFKVKTVCGLHLLCIIYHRLDIFLVRVSFFYFKICIFRKWFVFFFAFIYDWKFLLYLYVNFRIFIFLDSDRFLRCILTVFFTLIWLEKFGLFQRVGILTRLKRFDSLMDCRDEMRILVFNKADLGKFGFGILSVLHLG